MSYGLIWFKNLPACYIATNFNMNLYNLYGEKNVQDIFSVLSFFRK